MSFARGGEMEAMTSHRPAHDREQRAFDLFGRRVLVKGTSDGWSAFYQDNDGKRRLTDFVIPQDLGSEGIAR